MSEFNKAGVPYYAHPDTPSPRPRKIPASSQEVQNNKANRMIAHRYVRTFIKENWKEGDRFQITTKTLQRYDSLGGWYDKKSEQAGLTGTFKEMKLCGNVYFIYLSWDDPTYKITGLGRTRLGMFDFYHFAFKEGETDEL
jgi:hypothetical protein